MDFSISKRAQDLRQRAREFVKREAMPLEPRLTGSWSALEPALRQAALSRISLTLRTQQATTSAKKGGTGRFERATRDAGSFLAGAGAVVLFLLIVLSPFAVLLVVGLLALRAYRRREERRLLASA